MTRPTEQEINTVSLKLLEYYYSADNEIIVSFYSDWETYKNIKCALQVVKNFNVKCPHNLIDENMLAAHLLSFLRNKYIKKQNEDWLQVEKIKEKLKEITTEEEMQ